MKTIFCIIIGIFSILQLQAKNKEVTVRTAIGLVELKHCNNWNYNHESIKLNPNIEPQVYLSLERSLMVVTVYDTLKLELKKRKITTLNVIIGDRDTVCMKFRYVPNRKRNYPQILKQAAKYDLEHNPEIPQFTYQSTSDSSLVALRKEFNLDSIAGDSSEVSKIVNLMFWLHNQIRHDGNNGNVPVRNASSIINVCKTENRGVNCRMMAIALNECYLALGIKSRYVTCKAKDLVYNDCHVINMVYSNELKKWLWMDPTWAAYVMDDAGNMLSIEEVRERIIQGKPLAVNPEANWNHKRKLTERFYCGYYMAKNLYRMETPLESKFDIETAIPNKKVTYVQLWPLDFYNVSAEKSQVLNKDKITIKYTTRNPNVFWAAPNAEDIKE